MKIIGVSHNTIDTPNKEQKKINSPKTEYKTIDLNNAPSSMINRSIVNFGSKNQFSGIDLMILKKFKVPSEKFKSNADFQNWCKNEVESKYISQKDKLAKSLDKQAEIQKSKILSDWINYVTKENDAYTPAIQLMILSSITHNLSSKTNHLPPVLNKRKLADTIMQISENCKKDKKYSCNFDKLYRKNLRAHILTETKSLDESISGWIVIPSKDKDPKNFDENVKKLQTLSCDSWCTKTYNAEPYLEKGDFHIYYEKGSPKIGVRFSGDEIEEIQGPANNTRIPFKYYDMVSEHIEGFALSENAQAEIKQVEEARAKINEINTKFGRDVFKNKEYDKILPELGIKISKAENGKLVLYEYNADMHLSDYDIDENDLISNVIEIKGDADFTDTSVTNLGSVEKITGDLVLFNKNDFNLKSNIKSLGQLREVTGTISFDNTEISSLGNLEKIGGDLILNENITSMGKITRIDGNFDISASGIESLDNVEYIGGDFTSNSWLKSTGKLKEIGGDVYLFSEDLTTLGELNSIGGNAHISSKEITSLGDLKNIKGNCEFNMPSLTTLGSLEHIVGSIEIYSDKLNSTGKLNKIGGTADFSNCPELKKLDNLEKVGGDLILPSQKIMLNKLSDVGGVIKVCSKLLPKNTINYINHLRQELGRSSKLGEVLILLKQGLKGKQIKTYKQYYEREKMPMKEAAYEASFSPVK